MNSPQQEPIKWRQHLSLDLPKVSPSPLWIHACSVGEVASVAPLIRSLIQQGMPLHLTVVTKTGMQHARRCFSDQISISYLPWDLPTRCAKLFKHIQPRALLIAETEFWPGLLKAAKKHHTPVISINARISDRSFPRYQKTSFYWRRVLSGVNLFLAQSDIDAQRLEKMGIPSQRIQSIGNLKYATPRPEVDLADLQQKLDPSKQRPIIVLASSHENEEQQILEQLAQWQSQYPNLLLVIVPRHPQRFDTVAELIHDFGFSVKRWSQDDPRPVDVLLVDAMGVLNQLYAICDIAIIAGSFSNIGGHNPLEAAIWGKGVLTGPYVQNFRQIMQEMQQQGAAIICKDKNELASSVIQLLQNDSQRLHLHRAAEKVMENKERILQKTLTELHKIIPSITA
ncbi:MAG: 3-deoxy-D-manno-octulosonic acid transferase [Mariprofundaceae bacterium]|nr:3-deoxy-D-manno-octulosonic acid transferase [Mariprofundaceae bacterium]